MKLTAVIFSVAAACAAPLEKREFPSGYPPAPIKYSIEKRGDLHFSLPSGIFPPGVPTTYPTLPSKYEKRAEAEAAPTQTYSLPSGIFPPGVPTPTAYPPSYGRVKREEPAEEKREEQVEQKREEETLPTQTYSLPSGIFPPGVPTPTGYPPNYGRIKREEPVEEKREEKREEETLPTQTYSLPSGIFPPGVPTILPSDGYPPTYGKAKRGAPAPYPTSFPTGYA